MESKEFRYSAGGIKSTAALQTPRSNGHPDNTDKSLAKTNKLQMFDSNKLSQLWTLANEDTNSPSPGKRVLC